MSHSKSHQASLRSTKHVCASSAWKSRAPARVWTEKASHSTSTTSIITCSNCIPERWKSASHAIDRRTDSGESETQRPTQRRREGKRERREEEIRVRD